MMSPGAIPDLLAQAGIFSKMVWPAGWAAIRSRMPLKIIAESSGKLTQWHQRVKRLV